MSGLNSKSIHLFKTNFYEIFIHFFFFGNHIPNCPFLYNKIWSNIDWFQKKSLQTKLLQKRIIFNKNIYFLSQLTDPNVPVIVRKLFFEIITVKIHGICSKIYVFIPKMGWRDEFSYRPIFSPSEALPTVPVLINIGLAVWMLCHLEEKNMYEWLPFSINSFCTLVLFLSSNTNAYRQST